MEKGWFGITSIRDRAVVMHTPSQNDVPLEKWRQCAKRQRSEIITAFLSEYGEHASWQEWRSFLHDHQVKGFEWTESVD